MTEEFIPFYRRPSFWRFVIIWGLFMIFLYSFRTDLLPALSGWRDLLLIVLDYVLILLGWAPLQIANPASFINMNWYEMLRIPINIMIFCAVYLVSLFVVAQFVLPVHSWHERVMAWRWLRSYLFGRHGPAVFVREGKLIRQAGEEDSTYPGVALVDLRSAIVLEQTNPWALEREIDAGTNDESPINGSTSWFSRRSFSQEERYPLTRVCGPGINFTEWGEKIRNVIDLRPQIRIEPGVKAFTKDGIEVETRVIVGFSLSNPPDVIPVAYVGGNSRDDLFGLVIEEKSPGVIAIKGRYSLDPQDAWEIHRLVESGMQLPRVDARAIESSAYAARGPFAFDENRIFSAAYGQAHRGLTDEKTQWHELPVLVAVEIFRHHLEQYTYDYLYALADPRKLPWWDEIKPEFIRKVKHQGLLSFKLVRFAGSMVGGGGSLAGWNINPLDEKQFGNLMRQSSLEYSPVYKFQNTYSKPLREHGITVLFAGFSELKPPPAIREKMADRWKAKLDLEIKTILAKNEREAMQLINSARTQAQRDATYFLSNLLKRETHSKEALALLLFQALQVAATDEKNHKDLPPREILGMMQNLHRWLLVEWEESDAKRKNNRDSRPPSTPIDQSRNS